jgi:hypothetical protein
MPITMLVLQIDPSIIVALIGVFVGVLPVGMTYVLTKRKEINANIREEKTKRYDDLIGALTAIVTSGFRNDADSMIKFYMAYNKASAYASDLVLEKCNDLLTRFKKESDTGVLTPEGSDRIIAIINDVYGAIRKDINPKSRYLRVDTFWAESK